ncbi:conserved hypothetical protein [Segniliparus rotundus DSM 44985]|uniref:Uncharacterized protein n=1 Tax=Segniliparus rotundus (strain ATCC BAA-972 / CDC 1076 / CIP 108378 / DSM 44985 / JCM 13578) TaxID=640132 RepID=D6ZEP1_SEGRD|nr:hypothetical protein [Segniliparus rotundus]ADG97415.1 conserved hypothetical protein [Segniliparus rotundus DSM 44985]
MSNPSIGRPGAEDPFEKMRFRPAGQGPSAAEQNPSPHSRQPESAPSGHVAPSWGWQQHSFPAPDPHQGFPPSHQHAQQAPAQYSAALPEGAGQLVLDTGFFWLAWIFFLTGPSVRVDGVERARNWGKAFVPVPPGQHLVEVYTRYLWPVGRASLPVFVQPGQTAPVFYRAPAIVWCKGAIGHEPQKTPGLVLTFVIFGALALLACVLPFVSLLLTAR